MGALAGQLPFAAIVIAIVSVQLASGTLSWSVPQLWYGLFGTIRAVMLGLVIGPASAAVFWAVGGENENGDDSSASLHSAPPSQNSHQ
jgi:hypothetical protein